MPGSGDEIHFSQGATVSFGGDIGLMTGFTMSSPKVGLSDVTTMESAVVGSGIDARVRRDFAPTSVDSGSVTVRLLGCPPFTDADVGTSGTLTIETTCGSYSWLAVLDSYELEASVGELLRGSVTFLLTGEP